MFNNYFNECVAIDYDYITGNELYGRDTRLENVRVTSVDVDEVVARFISHYKNEAKNPIIAYCIDRIVRHFKPWETQHYYVNVDCGYYGEEIGTVEWTKCNEVRITIEEFLNTCNSDIEKIFYVLKLEYGYILESIASCKNVEIKTVSNSQIFFGQMNYYKHLNPEVVESYNNYKFPRGIFVHCSDKYRIIDGHHRTANAKQLQENIQIIILN